MKDVKADPDQNPLDLNGGDGDMEDPGAWGGMQPADDSDVVDAEFQELPQLTVERFAGHTLGEIAIGVATKRDVFDAAWLQSRFAPTTEEAERVVLQLLDQGVIVLEQENEESRELNTYRVVKKPGISPSTWSEPCASRNSKSPTSKGCVMRPLMFLCQGAPVAGHNGAGKSSLLDAISHAFTGKPGRVAQKQHIGQLIIEGAKKGRSPCRVAGRIRRYRACGVALPSGKGSPSPTRPSALRASTPACLPAWSAKERRRVLFDLTGASASPAEVGSG